MLHSSAIGFTGTSGPMFGINALTLLSDAYNNSYPTRQGVNYSDQVQMMLSMGARIYRTSIQADADGGLSTGEFNKLLGTGGDQNNRGMARQTRAAGIRNLAVLLDRMFLGDGLWSQSNAVCFAAGRDMAEGFAELYGMHFDYFELSNEVTLMRELKLSPATDGSQSSHYDASIVKAAHYIAGMNVGLKSVLPLAKTVANTAGYWRTYWMQLMLDITASYGSDIDFVGWHWYSEMPGVLNSSRGSRDPIGLLYAEFGKPIWFTEIGSRWNTGITVTQNQQVQVNFFNEFMGFAKNNPKVFAVNYHELTDRPTTNYNSDEQNYGLYRWPTWESVNKVYGTPQAKLLAEQLLQ